MQEISIKNMIKAYNYIESVKNRKPEVADLVKLHKIVLADTPEQELIGGRLRTPETDELVRQIFHVTKDPKSVVNDYSASKDVVEDLKNWMNTLIKTTILWIALHMLQIFFQKLSGYIRFLMVTAEPQDYLQKSFY